MKPGSRTGALSAHLQPGHHVFVAGLSGESALLREELSGDPERAAGVEFTSVQLPGVDRTDYLQLHPASRLRGFFMTAALRAGLAERRAALHPLDYPGIARHLIESDPFDSVIAQFTPPDDNGWCSPGLSADFAPLVWSRAKYRVGHLNSRLPRLSSSFRVHVSEFDDVVECESELLDVASPKPSRVNETIGRHAANLVRDDDTLQFGIGSVLPEVARALHAHRRLRIHSGMIASFVETMWDSGALDRDTSIVTGVVLGPPDFYDYAGRLGRIHLCDVRETHDVASVARISRFVALNSAAEVDLFGQINSERSNGTIQSGAGGLPAFAEASQIAPGGRLVICLPATARQGQYSRIVPALDANAVCTVPRYLADAVVTEFGVAELRGRSIDARAEALISIAAPFVRKHLAASWEEMRRRF